MNYQSNKKNGKATQMKKIYVTLSLALIVMAVFIGASGIARRSSDKVDETIITTGAIATVEDQQVMAPHTSENTETEQTEVSETAVETEAEHVETESDEEPTIADVLPDFVSPVSGYLMKSHSGDTPVFSATMNDYRPHTGVDIFAGIGDDVFAVADGTVEEVWEDPMSGNCVSISHSGGAVSVYRNLSPTLSENMVAGNKVTCGEVIGSVGESSLLEIADEPHLHFEMVINDESVDPAKYIAFTTEDTEYED